ncbi:type II secretion system F family protein [Georgenia subflava]|uniref:Type II secretion system F family protein n=1 Tax=Georgenia subflava TaxID=1622177 RepID=A0A6N7EHW5_9MICO|nr:type II secretion system F family protein [Georgenia subflava]MPV37021.1 type II secretion system F family protein [Georgenia subflava]
MPPLVLVAVAAVSVSLPLLVWSVVARPDRARQQVVSNLRRGLEPAEPADDGSSAAARALAATARRLTPRSSLARIERLLSRAGRPEHWSSERVVVAKLLLAVLAGALGLLYLGAEPTALSFLLVAVVAVVAYFLPELLLHSRGQERSETIALELADTLDQMTIAVEAGLGFDAAVARAGRNGTGPLAAELVRTVQDIQMGQSRRQAYDSLARRTDVADLRRFIRAVVQADTYGIAIADVLRTQAAEMRIKRRQRAEEKAMQIPVKVIFPLLLCILPVLFVVLLGPAVMDIVAAFS